MDLKLAVILVNYNQKNDILECLESLEKSTYQPYKIIVSDNDSTDGSVEAIRYRFPHVHIILNRSNVGYAAANNNAFFKTPGLKDGLVLLLNSDTIVKSDFLLRLAEAAKNNPTFDIIGPKIYYHDKPNVIWFAGGYLMADRCSYYHRGHDEIEHNQYNNITRCDFVTGCALLIKAELYRKLRGFDARLFMYCEDLDLCLRAKATGANIMYVPQARLYHKVRRTTLYNVKPINQYYYTRNMLYTVKSIKHNNNRNLSYCRPLLHCIKHTIKLLLSNFPIGFAGTQGIIDFMLGVNGRYKHFSEYLFPNIRISRSK